tara:strand:+ start:338 stop:1021 length:684 start_codon:yes stop_codon:yes gene_type:complete
MMQMKLSTPSQRLFEQFALDHPGWEEHSDKLLSTVSLLCEAYHKHALLLTCGNGGSASDASHLVGELVKSFTLPRSLSDTDKQSFIDHHGHAGAKLASSLAYGLRAVSLPVESVLLTAMGNDVSFDIAFAQQVYALGQAGDILIAMSTSGNSANVIAALQAAKVKGMHTVGLTGQSDCPMDELCDLIFHAPSTQTYRVQEYHLALYHMICLLVESQLFATSTELAAT